VSHCRFTILAGLTIGLFATLAQAKAPSQAELDFFEAKIRPVLVKHCYECHSADAAKAGKLKGGLQLDTRAATLQGGDSGPAVVPGDAKASLLLEALRFESLEMPPDGKLADAVIADFEQWIAGGAADPRDGKPAPVRAKIDFAKARQFWSLQPIRRPEVPNVSDARWPTDELDSFILARLDQEKLTPSEPASKRDLLRRWSFALTGLPPTIDELNSFTKDESPQAAEHVVDRLLASPHYGERWGRHWLDVARYADSCGGSRNMVWRHAWRYRNYVIDAFNADKRFDEFIREQVAGDLLPASAPEQRDKQRIATTFLALGAKTLDEPKRDVFRMDLADEQIDVVSRGFLGLSVACARCHDHKFDPIPTRDYYALAGILRSSDTLYGGGPKGIKGLHDTELQPLTDDQAQLAGPAREHLETVRKQTQDRNDARSLRYRVVRNVADMKRQLGKSEVDQSKLAAEIAKLDADIKDWDEKIKQLDADLAALVDNPPPQPAFAMGIREGKQIDDCRIHIRGETTNLGDVAPRGLLEVIAIDDLGPIGKQETGRRQLADWLANPHNPLPPRVIVNRVWKQLFGRGLVTTPDDFGINGSAPSHPELLDFLADRFLREGWSVKQLIRHIVLSRTFAQSSQPRGNCEEVDPDNGLLWRMRPRRLEAEALRDAMLDVSGQLDRTPLAESVVVQLNAWKQDEFNFATKLTPEQMEHRHRSVYLPVVRGDLPELLKLFDFADPTRLVGQRDETIVPAQALYLMNAPWVLAQSRHLADRVFAELPQGSSGERIERLYQLALVRNPADAERTRALAFLGDESDPERLKAAWSLLCQTVLTGAEFRYLE